MPSEVNEATVQIGVAPAQLGAEARDSGQVFPAPEMLVEKRRLMGERSLSFGRTGPAGASMAIRGAVSLSSPTLATEKLSVSAERDMGESLGSEFHGPGACEVWAHAVRSSRASSND